MQLLENNGVYTSEEDSERLNKMYGKDGKDGEIDMKAFIEDFKKLDDEQYSDYTSE